MEEFLDHECGGCKLQVLAPVKSTYTKPEQLVGRTVVTSFTAITEAYFRKLEGVAPGDNMSTKIKYVGGSVETACNLGVADGIVDLVAKFRSSILVWAPHNQASQILCLYRT